MKRKDLEVLAGIGLLYVCLEAAGITCPIKFFTGISCAGCGMSRAWLAVLRLDFASAFAFHPLFWLPVPAAAVLLLRKHLPERFSRGCLQAVCALFLAVYALRMIWPGDDIVVFEPWNSLPVRIWRHLSGKA